MHEKTDHLLDECLDEYMEANVPYKAPGMKAEGPTVTRAEAKSKLIDIINGLRAKGIPWASILAVIGKILPLIFAGTPYAAIIEAILAIIAAMSNTDNPTPAPRPDVA